MEDSPYVTQLEVMEEYNCDFCVHGGNIPLYTLQCLFFFWIICITDKINKLSETTTIQMYLHVFYVNEALLFYTVFMTSPKFWVSVSIMLFCFKDFFFVSDDITTTADGTTSEEGMTSGDGTTSGAGRKRKSKQWTDHWDLFHDECLTLAGICNKVHTNGYGTIIGDFKF